MNKDEKQKDDWIYDFRRMPIRKVKDDFNERLFKRIEAYEREKLKKAKKDRWQSLIDLLKNKYFIIIGAGLAVSVILIYLLLPGPDKKIPADEIVKEFSKQMKPIPAPVIEITQLRTSLGIKAENKHRILTLAELQKSLLNIDIPQITDSLAKSAFSKLK